MPANQQEVELLKQELNDVFDGKETELSVCVVTEIPEKLKEEDIKYLKELAFTSIMEMRDEREINGEKRI